MWTSSVSAPESRISKASAPECLSPRQSASTPSPQRRRHYSNCLIFERLDLLLLLLVRGHLSLSHIPSPRLRSWSPQFRSKLEHLREQNVAYSPRPRWLDFGPNPAAWAAAPALSARPRLREPRRYSCRSLFVFERLRNSNFNFSSFLGCRLDIGMKLE